MQPGIRQPIRDLLELVEAGPHPRDFVAAEQGSPHDPADLEEGLDLLGRQTGVAARLQHRRHYREFLFFVP